MNILLRLPFLLLFFGNLIFCQWQSIYSNLGNDYPCGLAIDSELNLYVAASTWTGLNTEMNTLLIKLNHTGNTLWTRQLDGPINGEDELNALCIDTQNNIIVTGRSESSNNFDYLTAKYGPSGNLLWTARYNGTGNGPDESKCIAYDNSNNIYVSGTSKLSFNLLAVTTIKYNSSGIQQWINNIQGNASGNNITSDIKVFKPAGTIYITGLIADTVSGNDIFIAKLSGSGIVLWKRTINGSVNSDDAGRILAVDENENIFLTGYITNSISGNKDIITCKYDSAGTQIWNNIYSGISGGNDIPASIALDNIGNCYITGESAVNTGNASKEFITISYNSAGNQRWQSHFNLNGRCCSHVPISIKIENNDVFVCGKTNGILNNFYDYTVVRYDSQSGNEINAESYHFAGTQDNVPVSMITDSLKNIYVTGTIISNDSIKIGTAMMNGNNIGITPVNKNIPDKFKLYQNYPNPFNPSTKINFSVPKQSHIKLSVYDVTGKKLIVIFEGKQEAGNHAAIFDGADFASGIYFYRMEAEGFIESKKMILIK